MAKTFEAKVFIQGAKDSIPFGISFFFLFLIIGAAYSAAGLNSFMATLATLLIFSAPSQLVVMDFLAAGSWGALLLATAIVNARLVFMSASLMPYFKSETKTNLSLVFQMLSTSSFALTFDYCKSHVSPNAYSYFLGNVSVNFPLSVMGTYVGAEFFQILPEKYVIVFNMILPIYFTHLLAKLWPEKKVLFASGLGFILAPILEQSFPNGGIILGALLASFIVMSSSRAGRFRKESL